MQPKGQKGTLTQPVDHASGSTGVVDQLSHQSQPVLGNRPYKGHQKTQSRAANKSNHGHKFCPRKNPQNRRKLNIVVFIMQLCHQKSHQDTAEHTCVQGSDSHDHGLSCGHGGRIQLAQAGEKYIHHIIHSQKADHAAQGGNAFFFFGIAHCHRDRKDNGQVGIDRISHGL